MILNVTKQGVLNSNCFIVYFTYFVRLVADVATAAVCVVTYCEQDFVLQLIL
jgi:hypothetical protein